ncbi:MAG: hypothetical protein IKN65_07010 [Clostridia bacterium]|nr:hypothetical protein [Clostridia bacterium]
MTEWKVAPSYENWEIKSVDETNHKAIIRTKCDKCGGTGEYAWFGVCFKCGGSSYLQKEVKIYTPEEYIKYVAAQARAKERRIEVAEARRQAAIDQSEENKKAKLAEWGYDPENPLIWLVGGGSTYEIKDWLKEEGCKFCKELGWYSNKPLDVPEGYGMVSIKFEDAYEWFPITKRFEIRKEAKEVADAALSSLVPESHSEFIGDIKERLRDLCVTLTAARTIDGYYGMSTIYTFTLGENILTWITSSCQDIEIGDKVLLTGTVKDHTVYKGIKQTVLSRCIIKKE